MSAAGRILVADDSRVSRTVIRRHLAEHHYDVVEAQDGAEALAVARGAGIDVVLLDMEMPVLDGFGVLEAFCGVDDDHPPVVCLTGLAAAEEIARALDLGAHDYLCKPFAAVELIARVRAAHRTKQLQDDLREHSRKLERLACTDIATGLPNRRFAEEHLARVVSGARRHGGGVAVLMIDVDRFKSVNDGHGHRAGDDVLRGVADRLRARLRTEEVIGRWGGDEFIVVATNSDDTGTAELAERLRSEVGSRPFAAAGGHISVTISAGWATWTSEHPEQLIQRADVALYMAKAAGRDAVSGAVSVAG